MPRVIPDPLSIQVTHSHSVYGKWLHWPLWPHRALIMVLLLKAPLTTITLKRRLGFLLRASSMPGKSTKGSVHDCAWWQRTLTFCLFTCGFLAAGSANDFGWEHSGAGNQWDKAILKNPVWAATNWCDCLVCLTLTVSVWDGVFFWLLSECVYMHLWKFLCVC